MAQQSFDTVSAVRFEVERGECDPRAIASTLVKQITPKQRAEMFHSLLSVKVREILRSLRSAPVASKEDEDTGTRWDSSVSRRFVYETSARGWINLYDMTLEDVEEQADNYRARAAANNAEAGKWDSLSKLMRKSGVATVGDLDAAKVQKVMR